MKTRCKAKKPSFLAIILFISLVFSSLLPTGVTPVFAQAPETPTLDPAITETTPPTEAPPAVIDTPTPTELAPTDTAVPTDPVAPVETTAPSDPAPTETPATSEVTPTETPTLVDTPTAEPTPDVATPTPPPPPTPPDQTLAPPDLPPADYNLLSDGQFVYGPNVGNFEISSFTADAAPQLSSYAETLFGRANFNSINPRLYLTLMEMATGLISNTAASSQETENPFGLSEPGFLPQLDALSESIFNAYYLHLYHYTALPVDQRSLPGLTLTDGSPLDVPGSVNAGSYAVLSGLASFKDAAGMATSLDSASPESFVQTYRRLFPEDDPLSQSNKVNIKGGLSVQAAPVNLLQFPYPRGEAWTFNGVHSNNGTGSDMSSIDFSNGWPAWGADTSNIWVVAAGAGAPTKVSNCNFNINHGSGWTTAYYHLDNIQTYSGTIQANDRIGIIANNQAQALCQGGSSTGPHVHFTLKYNGALVAINGTALSGWVIHAGTSNYDYNTGRMWLERNGIKNYAYQNPITNDAGAGGACSGPALSTPADGFLAPTQTISFTWSAVAVCTFSGYNVRIKDTNNMDSGGTTIVDTAISTTNDSQTLDTQWNYKDLYWGVRAANAPNGAYWSVRRFQVAPPPDSPTQVNPAANITLYTRPTTFTWLNPNSPAQNGYTLRISVSSNPNTSPWLVNASLANSITSYNYTFSIDKLYYWHMRTWNTSGISSAWVTRPFTIHGVLPGIPALSLPAKNALLYVYTPMLDWTDAKDANHYQVQIATVSTFTSGLLYDTTATPSTFTVPNPLPANAKYYWRVRTVNAGGITSAWVSSYFRTALKPPVLLTPQAGSLTEDLRPSFDWEDVTGAVNYAIQISTSASFSTKAVNATVKPSAYNLSFSLLPNRIYYWRVYAKGANPSAWASGSFTSASAPSVPTLAAPTENLLVTTYTPRLDWSTSTLPSGATFGYYELQISYDLAFTNLAQTAKVTNLGFSEQTLAASLSPNLKYYWKVRAFNNVGGHSLWSATRSFRTPLPAPVLALPQGAALTTRPTFTWNSVTGTTGYTIQVSTVSTFKSTVVNTSVAASVLSYTPGSDLKRSATLFWRVRAKGANISNWSDVFMFTSANPPPAPTLAAPIDSAILALYTPLLDWKDMAGASSYKIQVASSSTFVAGSIVLADAPVTSDYTPPASLAANSTFYWRVASVNSAGEYSLWSTARHFHTKLPAPSLTNPGNAVTAPAPATLGWGSVSGVTGYTVQVSTINSFTSTVINKAIAANVTAYAITSGLTKGKVYYWRVQAKGTYPSDWSEIRSFTAP